MINIIPPTEFKKIPWKNGKGETLELAINNGATLDNFLWRLSIASVASNGEFSNFSGYFRNLILLDGNGIDLAHKTGQVDQLRRQLDMAAFNGANTTIGTLVDGEIHDFNIMTKIGAVEAHVHRFTEFCHFKLSEKLHFAYGLSTQLTLQRDSKEDVLVPAGHLLKLEKDPLNGRSIEGKQMIIIEFI